jgi:phosphoenolpyruvate carboxylase
MNVEQGGSDRPGPELVIEVDGQLDAEVQQALEYLRDRLVGEIPSVLIELGDAVTSTYLEGLVQSGTPLRIVNDDGEPVGVTSTTAEQEAEFLAAAEAYGAWLDSPEGIAEMERSDRLAEFVDEMRDDTDRLYREWLEEKAGEFLEAKETWRRERRAALEAEFTENRVDGSGT